MRKLINKSNINITLTIFNNLSSLRDLNGWSQMSTCSYNR